MQKAVLWESEAITGKIIAGMIKLEVVFSFLATKLCLLNSFYNPCENGIEIEVTQEEERIVPNYKKLLKRFVIIIIIIIIIMILIIIIIILTMLGPCKE